MSQITIEIDEELLARAKRALGQRTIRATVEEALRRAIAQADAERRERAATQLRRLNEASSRLDTKVLRSEEMWR